MEKILIKLAEEVEKNGFSEDSETTFVKIAQANTLLKMLKDSPTISDEIQKEASFSFGHIGTALAEAVPMAVALTGVGLGAEALTDEYNDMKFRKKVPGLIAYAKQTNPSLRTVKDSKLRNWLNSAHTIAPRAAKDPELATTFLTTAHAVGGVDIATSKNLAEIQQRGGRSNNAFQNTYGLLGSAQKSYDTSIREI